jgi:hypothetical protein
MHRRRHDEAKAGPVGSRDLAGAPVLKKSSKSNFWSNRKPSAGKRIGARLRAEELRRDKLRGCTGKAVGTRQRIENDQANRL